MPYNDYKSLSVTLVEGIATVVIDTPPINIFTLDLYTEMVRLSDQLGADNAVRVVVMRSANPEFLLHILM